MSEKISAEKIKQLLDSFNPKKADAPADERFSDEEIKKFLKKITPNKDYLYILQPFGLPDILCAGGFSYAVQAKKNKSATVLILNESAKNFGISYENVANILYLPPQILFHIQKYLKENDIYERDNFIYGYLNPKDSKKFTVAENLNFVNYYRKKVFDIPIDTPCRPPIVTPLDEDEINKWNQRYTFDKERTIILSANIDPKNEVPFKFWENLVNVLKKKNYIVYSYIESYSNMSIPNTRPILASLSELAYIAGNVKCFIGANIGLFSFLSMTTDANIFFINNFSAWFFDTSKIFSNAHSRTFYSTYEMEKAIKNLWKHEKVITHVESLSHPKIDPDEVFYSYDDVLEKVLNAVEKL